jgi:hypothetical protein
MSSKSTLSASSKGLKVNSALNQMASSCSIATDPSTCFSNQYQSIASVDHQQRLRLQQAFGFASETDAELSKNCPFCRHHFSCRSSTINHINNRCCRFLKELNDNNDFELITQTLQSGYRLKKEVNQQQPNRS